MNALRHYHAIPLLDRLMSCAMQCFALPDADKLYRVIAPAAGRERIG